MTLPCIALALAVSTAIAAVLWAAGVIAKRTSIDPD